MLLISRKKYIDDFLMPSHWTTALQIHCSYINSKWCFFTRYARFDGNDCSSTHHLYSLFLARLFVYLTDSRCLSAAFIGQ